jgi:trimethylamine---corrinoid protein Co-methyltransferase
MSRNRPPRRERRQAAPAPSATHAFRHIRNPYAPIEVLRPDQLAQIHQASMRIVSEIGIDFFDDEALAVWQTAGARVDHTSRHVWIDPDLLLEAVAQAPAEFGLQARNPAKSLRIGGNHINFGTVAGAPFYSDMEVGRRPGLLADFERMVRLAHVCEPMHLIEGLLVEPQDVPVPQRHLEKVLRQYLYTDKAITVAAHGRMVANDCLAMAAILYGRPAAEQPEPVLMGNINANSPLRFDDRMLGAALTYAQHGQAVIITPFILAGAMSPVTIAAAIAQQNAEALACIALLQLASPGAPVVYGGFTTNVDMQSGSPAFGTPEGAIALFAGAQLARRYGLPYRGSGGLNTAKIPDAQASYETQMSLWPAVMGHANVIFHSAGWLEAGLVCSLEKFVIDMEGLAVMQHFLDGLTVNNETLALDSIAEVGPGGHHFGTPHTMARFRDAFYMPLVSDRQNYQNWQEQGGLDTAQRAHQVAQQLLKSYEQPLLDTAVAEALHEFVAQRKGELPG